MRGIALMARAVAATAKVATTVGRQIVANQQNQPSLGAEMRAFFRQGREDLLNVLMGGLAGQTREMGAPGSPTQYQVTRSLDGPITHRQQERAAIERTR